MQLGGYFHFYSGIDREGKKRFLNFDAFSRKKNLLAQLLAKNVVSLLTSIEYLLRF